MEAGIFIKKLIGVLFMPLPISLFFILLGLYFFHKKQKKRGRVCSLAGLLILIVFSLPITSQWLIKPIEFKYPKLDIENPQVIAEMEPAFVWVFGCYHSDDELLPLVAKLHQCSLTRVVQAVQIWRKYPNSQLLFTGFAGKDGNPSDPEINSLMAQELGVPQDSIRVLDGTRDSEDEILKARDLIGSHEFIVVSSASHMPRLDKLFSKYGLSPILSPAEYLSGHGDFSWTLFIPNGKSLLQSERALYEIMGNIWVWLKS